MELTKHENVSRQSSILKLPKQRLPLQCVITNSSSLENSPTLKMKRRVSFAKNRRIREFCNEAEPESVWDDTYEEHDLSSTKSNCSNSNEHPVIISVPCADKENFPVQLFLHNQIECTQIEKTNLSKEDCFLKKDGKIDTLHNNIEYKNVSNENYTTIFNNNHQSSVTIDMMNNTDTIQNNIKYSNKNSMEVNNTTFNHIKNCELLTNVKTINDKDSTKRKKKNSNKEIELSEDVQLSPSIHRSFSNLIKRQDEITKSKITFNMEKNNAVATYNNNYQPSNNAEIIYDINKKKDTRIFTNKSMELTETIQLSQPIYQSFNKVDNRQDEITCNETQIFSNNSIETSEIIPIYNKNDQFTNTNLKTIDDTKIKEKAEIFYDKSMELTEAVNFPQSIYQSFNKKVESQEQHTNLESINDKNIKEKTEIFFDKSMELTEAINFPQFIYQSFNKKVESQEQHTNLETIDDKNIKEKTEIFFDKSMELTEAVNFPQPIQKGMNKNQRMTQEIVPILNKNYQPYTNVEMIYNKDENEKTKIFFNKCMELTEVNSLPQSIHKSLNKTKINQDEINQNNTKNFSEESMEITDAVSIQKEICPFDIDTKKYHEVMPIGAEIFTETSMNTIENFPLYKNGKVNSIYMNISNKTQEKEEIFENKINCNKNFFDSDTTFKLDNDTEMIIQSKEVETNKSTETANIIIMNKEIHQSIEKVNNISQSSVKPVKIYNENYQVFVNNIEGALDKAIENKTNMASNDSRELTDIVSVKSFLKFNNDELDLTTVQNTEHKLKEKILINNKSIIDVEQSSFHINSENPKFTISKKLNKESEINHNKSNTYSTMKQNYSSLQKKLYKSTYETITESMDILKSPCIYPFINEVNADKVQSHKQSPNLDFKSNIILNESEGENIKIFMDKSMEITEIIATGHQSLQNNNKTEDTHTTNIYYNTSFNALGLSIDRYKSTHDYIYKETDVSLDTMRRNLQLSYDEQNTITKALEGFCEVGDESSTMNNKNTNYEHLKHDTIKVFHDISLEDTLEPTVLSNSTNNFKKMNTNSSIISNNVDTILNSVNCPKNFNKEHNYDLSIRFSNREESFHRITSDELNTLCASMNLPTLRSSRNESEHNNYIIPSRNNENVPEDSLKNNIIFEKQSLPKKEIYSENNECFNNHERTCESLHKENHVKVFYDPDIRQLKENSLIIQKKNLTENNVNKEKNIKCQQHLCNKIIVYHDSSIDTSKNLESSNILTSHHIISDHLSSINPSLKSCNSFSNINENNSKISSEITDNQSSIKTPINNFNNINDINFPEIQTFSEASNNISDNKENGKFQNSDLQISYDTSMDFIDTLSKSSNIDNEFKKKHETLNENENTSSPSQNYLDLDMDKNTAISIKHNLSRIPSDNTDALLATIDFETKLSYPLIINDKTTIKVLNDKLTKTHVTGLNSNINNDFKSIKKKKYLNEYYQNKKNKNENIIQNMQVSIDLNIPESNDKDKDCFFNKEIIESNEEISLITEKYLEELDKIEPPSFLCSESIQSDSFENILLVNNDNLNILAEHKNETNKSLIVCERENIISVNLTNNLQKGLKRYFDDNFSSSNKKLRKNISKLSVIKHNDNQINKLTVNENKKMEAFKPILSLLQDIKNYEKRNDCIWSIRTMSQKLIAVDFITKSFVVIIKLNTIDKCCTKDIEQIEIISRVSANSKNILIKIVHNLLLLTLQPSEIAEQYKMYEHILPLLKYISSEVIFAMNFMFDLKRLKAIHQLDINNERVIFMVASKKLNIILNVSLVLKNLQKISPNDIDVMCILGDIRKTDIMQLVINIKRDYKFLSRYINDIKNYITLMEETFCLNK